MRSRYLHELTSPEVGRYIAGGGQTAYLPVGSTEMHGLVCPIGTDSYIAEAFALLMAEPTNGLIFPTLDYTWAGSTDGFPGTISVDYPNVDALAKEIIKRAWRQGFRRIILISVHNPNNAVLCNVTRRIFETDGIPAMYVNPYAPFTEEARALFPAGEEAAILLAALRILGKESLYPVEQFQVEEQVSAQYTWAGGICHGVVGLFMQDERQHVCITEPISPEAALSYLEAQRDALIPEIEKLDRYLAEISQQRNQGSFRGVPSVR